jgi:transposase-like protein
MGYDLLKTITRGGRMNIDRLNAQFSNETICRRFFESARWPNGRICPHCGFGVSYKIRIKEPQVDRYECKCCKRHFTVTTKTVLHSTKLPLRKWLQAMYLIVSSSKGISSVVLARLIGVTQPTAWRMGHAIRMMMDPQRSDAGLLKGIVELDEKYVGGTPEPITGVAHKRGRGTSKQ